MNELLNNEIIEETVDNTVEVAEVAGMNVVGKAVKGTLIVGAVVGAVVLVKKVIIPKIANRKAKKSNDENDSAEVEC